MSTNAAWSWLTSRASHLPTRAMLRDPLVSFTPTRLRSLFTKSSARILLCGLVALSLVLFWLQPHYQRQASSLGTPIPDVSKRLARQLVELNTDLDKHYEEHGEHRPSGIFPFPTLTTAQAKRYDHLRKAKPVNGGKDGVYMFTTITRQISDQLPDLLAALLVTIEFLGPQRVAFSFLEGPSTDLTPSVFENVLRPMLLSLSVPAHRIRIQTDSPPLDFSTNNRIELLASLRNSALSPLWDDTAKGGLGEDVKTVVFMNDVYLKAEHLLEVLHMHEINRADMTTAWDWYRREPAYYYDVWVGRTIDKGDLFYPIDHAWWTPSEDLFPSSPSTSTLYSSLSPFQVFSAWNGLAVMKPKPFLPPHNVRFRRSDKDGGECAASECSLVCGDFWQAGFGKIQVVPSVQLAYERDVAVKVENRVQEERAELGWRQGIPPGGSRPGGPFKWQAEPPATVRCHPWPEKPGTSANVWEHTLWVPPYVGYET